MPFKFKGLLSAATGAAVLLSGFIVAADTSMAEQILPEEPGFTECARLDERILCADFENGEFYIEDRTSASRWYSTPVGAKQDEYAQGINKTNLYSHILLQYIDENGSENITNSYAAVLKRNGLSLEKIENGIKIIYNFKELGITVPVEISLTQYGFEVKLRLEEISETKGNLIYNITLFPFLSSASLSDRGFMLLPDGCGAISLLNNNRHTAEAYREPVYGEDAIEEVTASSVNKERVCIPAAGIKRNNSALFAFLRSGGGYAYVNACNSKMVNGYNSVYFDFQLRRSYTFSLSAGDENVEIDRSPLADDEILINYTMLEGDDAELSGMILAAQREIFGGRERNVKNGGIFLKTIAACEIKKSFLGIPYTGTAAVTTYKQLEEMLNEIGESSGLDISVLLKNFHSDEIDGKVTKRINPINSLGSKKEMKRLFDRKNTDVFVSCSFDRFASSGNGVNRFFDAARNLSKASTRLYSYLLSTFSVNRSARTGYLVVPDKLYGIYEKFRKKSDGFEQIDIDTLATTLYSWCKNKKTNSREKDKRLVTDLLKQMKADGFILTAPMANAYALPFLDYVYDVPASSSGFMMCDYSVPFYQSVINGFVGYSAESVNQSATPEDSFLSLLESGGDIAFTVMYNSDIPLKGTSAEGIFACRYNEQRETVIEIAKDYARFRNEIDNVFISGYEFPADGVVKTVFSNGTVLFTNHNAREVSVGAEKIPAGGYIIRRQQ